MSLVVDGQWKGGYFSPPQEEERGDVAEGDVEMEEVVFPVSVAANPNQRDLAIMMEETGVG